MRAFIFAVAAVCALAACGQPAEHAEHSTETAAPAAGIEVRDAWASQTPGGVDVSAGYLVIANGGDADDRLVSASSSRAARVEIHEMVADGAVMRMRAVDALIIPAHGEVALAPGGQHLMFFGVTAPFTQGETIDVRLVFETAGEVAVSLPVRQGATHGGNR
jgi:periplasmic copper chaperone A